MNFSTKAALQPFVDHQELAGAVTLVADKDGVLCHEAVGFADIAAQAPMQTDSFFWIASQTKPMTATALMMLAEKGLLKIEDPVEKFLPEFRGQMVVAEKDDDHTLLVKSSHPITIRNVLSHTSGLPFISLLEQPFLDAFPLDAVVRSYAMIPLQWQPDTQYLYSNAGINIAGRIIEVVSGQTYDAFMQENLFDPLDMTDTTFWPDENQLHRLAKTYQPNEAETALEATDICYLSKPLSDRQRMAVPAGGLFSTAADVARFCRMILRGGELDGKRYLSEDSVCQMSTRQTGDGLESYGLGWSVKENSFGHGGALATSMTIDAERELITIFLVQRAGFLNEGGNSQQAFRDAVYAVAQLTRLS